MSRGKEVAGARGEARDFLQRRRRAFLRWPDLISGGGFRRRCLVQTPIEGQAPMDELHRRRREPMARDALETTSSPIRRIQCVWLGIGGFRPVSTALGVGAGEQEKHLGGRGTIRCRRARPINAQGCRAVYCGQGRSVLEGHTDIGRPQKTGHVPRWLQLDGCGCALTGTES